MSDIIVERLLDSAAELFLERDFHGVSIRELAQRAGTSSGMIRYYFTNKQGLFEAMLKREYDRILNILKDIINQEELVDFVDTMHRVMQVYEKNPNFPRFIVKTYLLRHGPGTQIIKDFFQLEKRIVSSWVRDVIAQGKVDRDANAEVVRIAFMSLTLLPSLMIDTLKESYSEQGYAEFRDQYVAIAGNMVLGSVKPRSRNKSKSTS
ncbi:MAG: TetR/AcrR family transcriptional regulator [Oceanospirillaceae bacterium]|nr:TetR/AcrR family transcriptional regulator [Oceanospirillaceae bacterium]